MKTPKRKFKKVYHKFVILIPSYEHVGNGEKPPKPSSIMSRVFNHALHYHISRSLHTRIPECSYVQRMALRNHTKVYTYTFYKGMEKRRLTLLKKKISPIDQKETL